LLHSRTTAASPVLAVLLMIAVAISASVLAYVWTIGLTGNLMGGGGTQVKEQVIVESYRWDVGGDLTITLRNVGTSTITVSAVYVGGNLQSASGFQSQVIGVGTGMSSAWTPLGTFTAGTSYTLKVLTVTGGIMTSVLMCGGSG
jgi:FlaG/FlaF family flagellin (archaellin)